MREEMNALEKNQMWKIVKLPKEKKQWGCKWVYAWKYKVDGSPEQYKTKLSQRDIHKHLGWTIKRHWLQLLR